MKFLHNLQHCFQNYALIKKMDLKTKSLYYFYFFLGLCIIILQLVTFMLFNYIPSIFIFMLMVFSSLFLIFTIVFSTNQSIKLYHTIQSLEQANLHNATLQTSHDDVRAFKHDFSNIIQSIGGYITSNDMKGLEVYYSQLFDDCQKLNNLYTLNPDVINNPAIFRILSLKYYKACELGIHMDLHVFLDLNDLHMKIYEFCRILGILVDNAIEAASCAEEKTIHIEIRKDIPKNRQLLLILKSILILNVFLKKAFLQNLITQDLVFGK